VTSAGAAASPALASSSTRSGTRVVDGRLIHDGCIDLGPVEEVEAEAAEVAPPGTGPDHSLHRQRERRRRHGRLGIGLPTDSSYLWTDGRVALPDRQPP
jgi:hypothetical protein